MAEPQVTVDTQALRSVGVAVTATGRRIKTHFDGTRAALAPAEQPGWATVATLRAVVDAWADYAGVLRDRAVDAGARLTTAAEEYDRTDAGVSARFGRP
ncbi:type VII secretion target [Longispora sp. NPDC051575]|uniref:type VII secretion target n=1 Tax=Longispora sp. NPDC051575 TaxID=3154943 RepID=UPI00342FAAF4